MTRVDTLGCTRCGDPECLCDVNIEEPVPYSYGFGGDADVSGADEGFVHGSDILLTLKDTKYGAPWTQEKLAEFGEALMAGWDAMVEQRKHGTRLPGDRLTRIRDEVAELVQSGESMVDVPVILGLDWDTVACGITHGTSARSVWWYKWGDVEWLRWEALIEGPGPFKPRVLYNEVTGRQPPGGSADLAVYGLLELYGKRAASRDPRGRKLDSISQKILALMKQGETSPSHIQHMLKRSGVDIARERVRDRIRHLRCSL